MSNKEIRHYPGLNTTDPELVTLLKKIRYDLTDLQAKVSEALRQAGALKLEPAISFDCPTCGIHRSSAANLAEHIRTSHDGPVPAHYLAIEARAANDTKEAA